MQTLSLALTGVVGGAFMLLLGVLCFVFNRKVGAFIKGFPALVFGVRQKEPVDEMIFRGLAFLAGLFYAGIGLALLASSLV